MHCQAPYPPDKHTFGGAYQRLQIFRQAVLALLRLSDVVGDGFGSLDVGTNAAAGVAASERGVNQWLMESTQARG